MAKRKSPTPVKFGPRERRVYYGPKRPKWFRGEGDTGVRTVISLGGKGGTRSAIKFAGEANVEVNVDTRHLADALRTVIGIHTGRAAAAGVRPDSGAAHNMQAVVKTRKMYERELKLGGKPEDYDVIRTVQRGPNKGQPSQWARTRFVRSGDTAGNWRVGLISGSTYRCKSSVYPSDDIPVRVAASQMLKAGYDLHSTSGRVAQLIEQVVRDFANGCIGKGVTIPNEPPALAARPARSPSGKTWYRVT